MTKWLRTFALGMWELWTTAKPDRMAAALAFYSLFALIPLLYIALLVAGFFLNDQLVVQNMIEQLSKVLGTETGNFIRDLIVGQAQRQTNDSILISLFNLAVLLYIASGLFGSLEDMLNLIWGNPFPSDKGILAILRTQFLAFVLVIGVGLVIVLLTTTDFVLSVLARFINPNVSLSFLNNLLFFVFTVAGFGFVYRVLARTKVPWRFTWLGALVAGLGLALGRWLFGFYLQITNFGSIYAAAGVLVVLLLAVYYSALIFLAGAMFVRVVPETQAKRKQAASESG